MGDDVGVDVNVGVCRRVTTYVDVFIVCIRWLRCRVDHTNWVREVSARRWGGGESEQEIESVSPGAGGVGDEVVKGQNMTKDG